MDKFIETTDYLEYYTNRLSENLISLIPPCESEGETGLELFERYAEIFVLLLKYYKQEFTDEQASVLSEAIYQKYREISASIDLTCQYQGNRKEIIRYVAGDNPDPDGIEFLQNWSSPKVQRFYKTVYEQLAKEWLSFKDQYPALVEKRNEIPLYKTVCHALDRLSEIPNLTFYRER
jgi:hypothetical protein